MILAETTTSDAMTFWQLLQIGSFLSSVFCPLAMLVILARNGKQRREVSFEFEPVSKNDFETARLARDKELDLVRADLQKTAQVIEQHRQEAEKAQKISSAGIYRKIDEVRVELSQDLKTASRNVDERLDDIPGKIVTLLRNTGAIGDKN